MTDKKELQEEELNKVNGGITHKSKDEINSDAICIGDTNATGKGTCCNFSLSSSFDLTSYPKICGICAHLIFNYTDNSFYCENSSGFYIDDSSGFCIDDSINF